MKLPNVHLAVVSEAKVKRYLLDVTHSSGGSKALFFLRFGFAVHRWQVLAGALQRHARDHDVVFTDQDRYGRRYAVDGLMVAPTGEVLNVRTVWFIDKGDSIPRLVSAYPLPRP